MPFPFANSTFPQLKEVILYYFKQRLKKFAVGTNFLSFIIQSFKMTGKLRFESYKLIDDTIIMRSNASLVRYSFFLVNTIQDTLRDSAKHRCREKHTEKEDGNTFFNMSFPLIQLSKRTNALSNGDYK